MSASSGLGKCILIILNVIFMVVALGLLVCGVLLRFFLGVLLKSSVVSGVLQDTLTKYLHVNQVPNVVDLGSLGQAAGLALLVVGGLLFLLGFLAVCGACCGFRPLLGLFAGLLSVLVLAQVVVFALVMVPSSPVHKAAREWMDKEMTQLYGHNNQQGFTATMDVIMFSMQCCGIEGPGDFLGLNLTVDGQHVTLPTSCCKRQNLEKGIHNCNATQAYDTGCYNKLLATLDAWKPWLVPVFLGLVLFQGVEITIAIMLMRDLGKSSDSPI